MGHMKIGHWLLVALSLYEIINGVYELSSGATLASLPTAGTLSSSVAPTMVTGPSTAGWIDLIVGILIFWFPLHHHLMSTR